LNLLYEPAKFPDPGPILQFNRETVLLVDAEIDRRVLAGGEKRPVTISISHYGVQPIDRGRISWEVTSKGQTLQRGVIDGIRVKPGEVKPVGTFTLGPYEAPSGRRLRLSVRLESAACRQENQWDFWVFPPAKAGLRGKPMLNLTGVKQLDDRYGLQGRDKTARSARAPADPELSVGAPRLILANRWTPEVADQLARGRTVLLLAEEGTLARPRGFTFWAPWIRSTGTFIEDHPALVDFPHDGFCAYQFYRLFGDGLETLQITEKGSTEREKLVPIVWGLSGDYDPALKSEWSEPRNRWKLYRLGLVCEGRVGSGRLVVCCLRLLRGVQNGYPEAGYLLDCLVEDALLGRAAIAAPPMSAEEASRLFRPAAPSPR
jgi:hypothetical protein